MTSSSPTALLQPLARYFESTVRTEVASLFAPDASVRDEGRSHVGLAEIRRWLASVEERYQPRYCVLDVDATGMRTKVTVEVTGTFPGSPAVLRQVFDLDGSGQIAGLETL